MKKSFMGLMILALVLVTGCGGVSTVSQETTSPVIIEPLTNIYENNFFGINIKYPENWQITQDTLSSSDVQTVANVPTDTLLTAYLPNDGVKTILSDALYGSNVTINSPPGQEFIGVAINVGTDVRPVWQPLLVGLNATDSLKDHQCLEDPLANTLTFTNAPPNLLKSVRLNYSINMWSSIVNINPMAINKTDISADFAIEVMHSPQSFQEWSQNILNSKNNIISGQTTLSGYPAYEITSKGTDIGNKKQYESLKVWTFINGRIYIVDAGVEEPYQYSQFSPTFEQMINSLQIN